MEVVTIAIGKLPLVCDGKKLPVLMVTSFYLIWKEGTIPIRSWVFNISMVPVMSSLLALIGHLIVGRYVHVIGELGLGNAIFKCMNINHDPSSRSASQMGVFIQGNLAMVMYILQWLKYLNPLHALHTRSSAVIPGFLVCNINLTFLHSIDIEDFKSHNSYHLWFRSQMVIVLSSTRN